MTLHLEFSDASGLLMAMSDDTASENPIKVWTYSDFEKSARESITPSMYSYMALYVLNALSGGTESELENSHIEDDAVFDYFNVPWDKRLDMHIQTTENLRRQLVLAEQKEKAAIDWMLEEDREPSVIQAEVCDFVRGLVVKYRCLCERLESELHEEEQWRGGWEDGASQTDGPLYDEMDEP
jgi:uncharacterized membrane protein YheB (UPF0754 family)